MKDTALRLYYSPSCFFCQKVLAVASELNINWDLIDVRQVPEARQKLIAERGRGTVPVLQISIGESERLLPESSDIITYLRTHAVELANNN